MPSPRDESGPDSRTFRQGITPDMGFAAASAAARRLKKLRRAGASSRASTRVAVLGSHTTSQLSAFLELFLFAGGIDGVIYEAPYGLMRHEILDPESELYRFAPQFVVLAGSRRDLSLPPPGARHQDVVHAADAVVTEWRTLGRIAHERSGCRVIQNNFEAPAWRTFGNLEMNHPGAIGEFVDRVNRGLRQDAPEWLTLHDLDGLAASVGRWQWGDERYFHLAKLPCAPEHLTIYAHSLAALISAHLGRSRKCLVLDLDNTLWGGVIGDDGMRGLSLGAGDPVGEAYVEFQRYVRALSERGVVLAVCSKNEESNAREPFERHPGMVLKLDDIACFVANWEDKATNLARIAETLNLGLDALVFVDDLPHERALVRSLLPDVAVPELPADPADYIRAIEQHRYFEVVSVTQEDLQRTAFYRSDMQRRFTGSSAADLDAFLQSLEMRASIGPIGPDELARATQLIGKSNQFNLTTRRHSATDVQRMAADPRWVTRVVALADRFGDQGLISVLLAEQRDDTLFIDTWLMSCRVLKRGVEQLLLNDVVAIARDRGICRIVGEYDPTSKNALVQDHYARLGFAPLDNGDHCATRWQLAVGAGWEPLSHHIGGSAR